MKAQVIVLAGPSGAGKSSLARRLGLPVLRLDDFYKDGSDPTLPRIADGPNAGVVDWDHPGSWLREDALAALRDLCENGRAQVPVYEIARDGRTGSQELDLGTHTLFVAEGIFAQEVVATARDAGQLAAAYCVTQPAVVTFWRRLVRDLEERRKPPLLLVRRGLALMRAQPAVVADCVAQGCTVATSPAAYADVRRLLAARTPVALPWGPALRQPDAVSCGATSVVVARMLRDPEYAAETLPRFGEVVLATHRSFALWPRRLGTAFWSVEQHLRRLEGRRYVLCPAYVGAGRAFDRLHAAAAAGRLAALYVGTRRLPMHVVLIVGGDGPDLCVFDPADGLVHPLARSDFTSTGFGGWPKPWTVVVPARL